MTNCAFVSSRTNSKLSFTGKLYIQNGEENVDIQFSPHDVFME